MSGMMWGRTPSGKAAKVQVTEEGAVVVSGAVGGGGSGGTSDTTEATALLIKMAVQSIDTKTPAPGAVQPVSAVSLPLPTGAATAARQDTSNTALGAPGDARAAWYDSAASIIQLLKLSVAAFVGAGARTYIYTNGVLTSEQWTLFGTTRTKTYTYTGGVLTGESDWV